MFLAAVLVCNRNDSVLSAIKKVFAKSDMPIHIINNLSKVQDIKTYLKTLEQAEISGVFMGLSDKDVEDGLHLGIFFDIVIYDNMAGETLNARGLVKSIHSKTILISNGDDKDIPDFAEGSKMYTITYGFSQKCSITPSCVDTENDLSLNCCVQRGIETLNGKYVEPGEYPYRANGTDNIYDVLAALGTKFAVGA